MKYVLLSLGVALSPLFVHAQQYERYHTLIANDDWYSKYLNNYRGITVTVPQEFEPSSAATYPLIIVFDRQNERSHGFIHQSIDYLTANEQMPASIIIGVESTMEERYKETQMRIADPNGRAEENALFITEELLPWARTQLKAGRHVTLIGHSRYGYFTTYMLCKHPDLFSAVVSLSPFFTSKNVNLADSMTTVPARLPKDRTTYYSYAIGNDFPEDYHLMDSTLTTMGESEGFIASGSWMKQADHNVVPGIHTVHALYSVWERWSEIQNAYMNDTTGSRAMLDSLSTEVKKHYGDEIAFSLGILNGRGWQYFNDARYEDAITAWETMVAAYPPFLEGHLYMAEAERRLGRNPEQRLKKFMGGIITSQYYTEDEKAALLRELQEFEETLETGKGRR